jgi:glycosyltransferase involved in cell wall biosynthesis
MEVYASELGAALRCIGDSNVRVLDFFPQPAQWLTHLAALTQLGTPRRYLARYAEYQWMVKGNAGDVNHIIDHGYGHLAFSLAPERTVITFHDALLPRLAARALPISFRPRVTILGHRLNLAAIRRSARVIADSQSARDDLLHYVDVDPARTRVIYLGVSSRFSNYLRERPQHAAEGENRCETIRILHVGHCGPVKNIEAILRCMPLISQRLGRAVEFVKAGAPFSPDQKALIERLGIAEHIFHLGKVSAADLPRIYAESDLLLYPSYHEGFGLPVLEAMACGTPVIAANTGSLPEIVADAGLLVNPSDQQAITEAVVQVATQPAVRTTLRQRGLERAGLFTWEKTARETLAVYRQVYEESH